MKFSPHGTTNMNEQCLTNKAQHNTVVKAGKLLIENKRTSVFLLENFKTLDEVQIDRKK